MKAQLLSISKEQLMGEPIGQGNIQTECSNQNAEMNHKAYKYEQVIQFGWNLQQQFNHSHIPNAVYMDSAELEYPPYWLLKPEQQICDVMTKYINRTSNTNTNANTIYQQKKHSILVYNRHVQALSIIPACRLALLLLHYHDIRHVDVLAGGYEAYNNQQSLCQVIRITYERKQGTPTIIIGIEELKQMISHGSQLVDIRTKPQFDGVISGYDYFHLKGRIPGSIYHGGTLSKGSCEVKQYSINGEFLSMWKSQNIDTNKHIILYCGSGWRVSQAMVYAALNGVSNISMYSNGWFQWSTKNMMGFSENKEQQIIKNQQQIVRKCCRRAQ